MAVMIDTDAIAGQFSKAAATYDKWAEPQALVAKRLCSFLPQEATHIVDLGCGTGIMARLLREKYPTAFITGIDPAVGMIAQCQNRFAHDKRSKWIVTTAESFSAQAPIDLVVSTNSFHWFKDKKKVLSNIHSSLAPSGQFAIATCLEHTLRELYESYFAATGTGIEYADLSTEEDYSSLFLREGFTLQTFIVEEFLMHIPTPMHLIHFLQGVGGAPRGISKDTLLNDELLQKLVEYYVDHFSVDGGVVVTFQYLYGVMGR